MSTTDILLESQTTTKNYASALPEGAELVESNTDSEGTRMEWWTHKGRRFMVRLDDRDMLEIWHAIEPFGNPEQRKVFLDILCNPELDVASSAPQLESAA